MVPDRRSALVEPVAGRIGVIMIDRSRLLEAHVQFELDHWTGAALKESIAEEVHALFVWLESVPLEEVVTADQVIDWAIRILQTPPSEDLWRLMEQLLEVSHEALLESDATLADLLPRQRYDQIVSVIVGLRDVRQVVIDQITTSTIYSELVSYVLYHGIKAYLVTGNLLARKIPGASSLLRFGHNAIDSAAPSLEKAVDKQLTAWMKANIQNTVRGSGAFLATIADDAMIRSVADEIWATNAAATVSESAGLLSRPSPSETARVGRDLWLHLVGTPPFRDLLALIVHEFFRSHGSMPVAVVLTRVGVGPEMMAEELGLAAVPIAEKARASGYLEARIRNRLNAFYATDDSATPPGKGRAAKRPSSTPRPNSRQKAAMPEAKTPSDEHGADGDHQEAGSPGPPGRRKTTRPRRAGPTPSPPTTIT
ncbi:MAG: hypothetical protein WAL50_09465 [Kineosporiaceae bacterium]